MQTSGEVSGTAVVDREVASPVLGLGVAVEKEGRGAVKSVGDKLSFEVGAKVKVAVGVSGGDVAVLSVGVGAVGRLNNGDDVAALPVSSVPSIVGSIVEISSVVVKSTSVDTVSISTWVGENEEPISLLGVSNVVGLLWPSWDTLQPGTATVGTFVGPLANVVSTDCVFPCTNCACANTIEVKISNILRGYLFRECSG